MGNLDVGGDDLGVGLFLLVLLLALPLGLALFLLSLELFVLLLLVPFLMSGQLLGWLPWTLVVRTTTGERRAIEVRGTRAMLEARRYYRLLRA